MSKENELPLVRISTLTAKVDSPAVELSEKSRDLSVVLERDGYRVVGSHVHVRGEQLMLILISQRE